MKKKKSCLTSFPDVIFLYKGKFYMREFGIPGRHMDRKEKQEVEMMKWQKNNSVPVEKAKELTPAELEGKILIGILVDRERPSYHEQCRELLRKKFKV
jgi:hypothetical protein